MKVYIDVYKEVKEALPWATEDMIREFAYKTWKADTTYKQDGTVETGTSPVYFDGSDMYVAYFMSATEIDLVKFATDRIGMVYVLTKVQ